MITEGRKRHEEKKKNVTFVMNQRPKIILPHANDRFQIPLCTEHITGQTSRRHPYQRVS